MRLDPLYHELMAFLARHNMSANRFFKFAGCGSDTMAEMRHGLILGPLRRTKIENAMARIEGRPEAPLPQMVPANKGQSKARRAANRTCLMCAQPFHSEWSGNRVCGGCKGKDTWRSDSGYALPKSGSRRAGAQ